MSLREIASAHSAPSAAVLVFAVCALLGPAPPAAAQQPPLGATITAVAIEQEGQPVTDPVIVGLVETSVGEPLSMHDVRETTAHLMSLGRFDDVQSYADVVPGGVRVRYLLRPLHPVDRVEFRGQRAIGDDDLRRAITDRFGRTPSGDRAADVAETLRLAYLSRGYPRARVTPRLEETHNPDRATLVLDIDAGPRAVITNVRLFQTDAEEQGQIPFTPDIREGQFYEEERIEDELQDWIEAMHEQGYYLARASHGPSFPEGGAFVSINLARGPHVTLAFTGDPLPEADRERLVRVRQEGSVEEDLLEDATVAIENYFVVRGYRDADAEFTREQRDGELIITFNVRRGRRHLVDSVRVGGHMEFSTAELRGMIGLREDTLFVRPNLTAGLVNVENAYRARGYIRMRGTATDAVLPPPDPSADDRRVEIAIAIEEGPRTTIRSVAFAGASAIPDDQLRAIATVAPGRPFTDVEIARTRDNIELEYRNRGHDSVVVVPNVTLQENETQADVAFAITEGPRVLVDHVIIVGNRRTSTRTIERELQLTPGAPLGFGALVASRSRLMELGLFRGVRVEPLGAAGAARRDVLVTVEEVDATTLDFGGGIEGTVRTRTGEDGLAEDRFEVAPRGFFQISRRNLWGKNRSVTLFSRVSLRPRDVLFTPEGLRLERPSDESGYGFNEYRVVGTFREPKIFDSRADALITVRTEQALRSSFNFSRRDVRAEASLPLTPRYNVVGRYSFERTKLFDEVFPPEEQPQIDRLFSEVRLSKVAASAIRNTRDDELDPSEGSLLLLDADFAVRALGSEVGFIRTYLQGFTYRRLPGGRATVLALGGRVGLAHGFAREREGIVVQDLPASERFFAGGDTSVRGFALDRVGTAETISPTGFPKGGNAVLVLNAELRVHAFGPYRDNGEVQGVIFVDAGNVYPRVGVLDVTDLRPAAGVGVRYKSPFGPVRVDLGFNLNRRELVAGSRERAAVLHVSLGQAF